MLSYLVFKDLVELHFRRCKDGDNHICNNKLLHMSYPTLFIGLDRVEECYGFKKFFNEYCSERDSWKRVVWLQTRDHIFDKQLVLTLFKHNKKGLYSGYALEELYFLDYLLRNIYNEFNDLFD